MASFYLDEDIPTVVRTLLAGHRHDVLHAYDVGHHNIVDTEHLLYAAQQGRILVSFNRDDFREAHRIWTALITWRLFDQHHAGILTSWVQLPAEEWAERVHEFVSQNLVLDNQMWEWRRQQQRWERFGW